MAASAFATVIGLVWLYTLFFQMRFETSGYPVWRSKFDAIASCSAGNDVMLGDSEAQAAYIPRLLSSSGYNLSIGGSTPLDAYLEMKKLAPCLRPGQHVMISISAWNFETVSPWLWQNGAKYGFFNLSDLRELAAGAASVGDDSLADIQTEAGRGMLRDLLYGVRFPAIYFPELLAARLGERGGINEALLHQADARRGFLPFPFTSGATGPVDTVAASHFHPRPVIDLFFRKTVAIAAAHGVELDFIATPLSATSAQQMQATYEADFTGYLGSIARDQPALKIVTPLFYSFPNRLFSDYVHLGQDGATQFTKLLRDCRTNAPCELARETATP